MPTDRLCLQRQQRLHQSDCLRPSGATKRLSDSMGDADLEAIRQKRMAELMSQYGMSEGGGGEMTPEARQQKEEQQQAQEEQRQSMLARVLQPSARERLARIALVKPDKARGVESMILQMAQKGALTERVSEERLIAILEQVNEQTGASTKSRVTIQRRSRAWEDDD
ncbi:hypothetical protein WJX73_007795 [Symbiochloris irregularis]|uniref:Programmed cell death protein 5 n=1 Tax=Symbiochloris irregularis TaxID=706552 RepID=A0AAW1PJM3_9CHLO